MKNLIYLLLFFSGAVNALTATTCTGGTGSDYGGMTCYTPECSIASDPSIGCTGTEPPPDPIDEGPLRCYLQTDPYLRRFITLSDDVPTWYKIEPDKIEMRNMCATNPAGYTNPSDNKREYSESGTVHDCYEMGIDLTQQFCANIQE